jgi:hypothetical protein
MPDAPKKADVNSGANSEIPDTILKKTKVLLHTLDDLLNSPSAKVTKMAVTEVKLSWSLKDLGPLIKGGNPTRGAYAVVTAVMIQKATAAANLASDSELAACADALASLGGDLTTAAVLAPETLGYGSLIPLAFAALDSYNVGKCCFNVEGKTTHAIRVK